MSAVTRYNNIFVKQVDDLVDLFEYTNPVTQDHPLLPSESILISPSLVRQYKGLDDECFLHQATLGYQYGKKFLAHSIHDYDEDANGLHVGFNVSTDDGLTWSELPPILPQMGDMQDYGLEPSQWGYPSMFLYIPSGFYILLNCVSNTPSGGNYNPLGTMIRKINSDNSYGDLLWINNGVSKEDRAVPAPLMGYPSYQFASEDLIEEVITYISQPNYRPKILFGMPFVWSTQDNYDPTGETLREPTEIRPYNYPKERTLKVWRPNQQNSNIVQIGEDRTTQRISELPIDPGNTAKRVLNYSPEIILTIGASRKPNREEIALCIFRKNNTTGRYNCAAGDAYSITSNTKNSPVFPGQFKVGGEQLAYAELIGKDRLDVAYSVAKEEIYFMSIDLKPLI